MMKQKILLDKYNSNVSKNKMNLIWINQMDIYYKILKMNNNTNINSLMKNKFNKLFRI